MWNPTLFIIALLGFVSALIAPIRRDEPRKSFSLGVEKMPGGRRHFVRDLVAAHQKWGKGVPSSVASTFSLLDDDGLAKVEPLGSDDIYIAKVDIGNPPQTLKIALDTGSADLWVQSSDTLYRTNPKGPYAPQYHPNASKTSHRIDDAEWEVQYMDGTGANGLVYLDTVRMGGFELHDTPVQSAKIIASRFEREPNLSGIMGLAKNLSNNIMPPTSTILDRLKPLLDRPVFSVDLRRNATGRFDFGHIDTSRTLDNMTWLNTNPESPHWDVTFGLTAWTGSHRTWWLHKFEATIDTGTTMMFLPNSIANLYWLDVPDMKIDSRLLNAYTFPCEFGDDLPDLMFKLPGTEHILTIPGPYLNYGPVEDDPEYCWGGMQNADGMDVTIFGDVMLKALYVTFDLESNKVGFANKHLDDI